MTSVFFLVCVSLCNVCVSFSLQALLELAECIICKYTANKHILRYVYTHLSMESMFHSFILLSKLADP